MSTRHAGGAAGFVVVTVVVLGSVLSFVSVASSQAPASQPVASLGAQGPGTTRSSRAYRAPRTPWGDPDLQGVFTNSNEYMTPIERPEEFGTRRLEELTPAELARVRASAEKNMIAALPGGRVRGPDDWWLQSLDVSKRNQPWLIVDPPDGRIPPLTADGARRNAERVRSSFVGGPFNGPEDLNPLERCISRSVPGSMIPVMYGNNYEILQTPDYVAIMYEIVHETRLVPLDGRPHLGSAIGQHMGDPRGHWENDTLVVETTNFKSLTAYRPALATTLKVTERFVRVASDRVAWSATIEDPRTWTRPWTIAMPLTSDPDPLLAYDCHEHNYGMLNILRGARAEDGAR